jgi:hypothetical protein
VLFSLGHKLQEDEKAVDLTAMILGFENFDVTAKHAKPDRFSIGGYLTLPEREFAANYLRKIRRTRDTGSARSNSGSEKRPGSRNYIARHWRGELSLPVSNQAPTGRGVGTDG